MGMLHTWGVNAPTTGGYDQADKGVKRILSTCWLLDLGPLNTSEESSGHSLVKWGW